MTDYYVSSVDGNDGDNGTTWALAKATLTGGLAVATSAGDVIRVSHVHQEVLAADTTYTAQNHVSIIVVDRSNSDALALMDGTNGYIGHTANSYAVTFAGAFKVYMRGLYFLGSGTTVKLYNLNSADGMHCEYESCTFKMTQHSGSGVVFGSAGSNINAYCKLMNCVVNTTNGSQRPIQFGGGKSEIYGLTMTGTACRFGNALGRSAVAYFEGCDISNCTAGGDALWSDNSNSGFVATMVNCKIASGVTVMAAQSTVPNRGSTEVYLFNCDDSTEYFRIAHYSALGETTVSNTIYANDGAAYDGTAKCSWKITTTANCTFYTPYVSPWIDVYHSGTSAITPYLEALRSGSTTKYKDNEVWSEWSYQGTDNTTLAKFANDRMTPLGSAVDQTASSLDASGWTGEDGTNNAFMKLESGSITPYEIGHIRARVCVGATEITVYVDPKIRGLT